ncbi:MAG: pilus assembly protein PilM [Deltaproteobacteria bacterium]
MFDLLTKECAGIYFSPRGFVVVTQKGGRLKDYSCFPYPESCLSKTAGTEDVFQVFQNNMVELIAFMQKSLRESRVDASNVVGALPSKDLIIRFFEMPQIPKSEVVAGINFEMKKYVPFKAEDLSYDFQYRVRPRANILEVILCGMRREGLNRYANLFKQLNLDVTAFEPSLFSLYRLLAVRGKLASSKSYVILEVDKDEADILIVDKGFPYFTRDIRLLGFDKEEGRDTEGMLGRLVNEVRVSLDYFRRQFMKKDVDEMLLVGRPEAAGWGDSFHRELGLKTIFYSSEDFFKGKDIPDDMLFDVFKACGAASRRLRPSLITLNLAKAEKSDAMANMLAGLSEKNAEKLLLDFLTDSRDSLIRGAMIGAVVVAMGYGVGFSKLYPLKKELEAKTIQQPPLLPGLDFSTLESIEQGEIDLLAKQRSWNDAIAMAKETDLLGHLPHLVPDGVWVMRIFYSVENKYLELECAAYDAEPRQRQELMNAFLARLKEDDVFKKEFANIELVSYREKMERDATYLSFKIVCSSSKTRMTYGGGTAF